jgi:predicted acyl esterase
LHDKPLQQPEAITFQTGTNVWKRYEEWPPKQGVTEKKLYFRADGKLSFDPPADREAFDSYVSDPANPVPYRPRGLSRRHIQRRTGEFGWFGISASWSIGLTS